MSTTSGPSARTSVTTIAGRKGGQPMVALTAYTAPIARALDGPADLLLVGMVLYGYESTLPSLST